MTGNARRDLNRRSGVELQHEEQEIRRAFPKTKTKLLLISCPLVISLMPSCKKQDAGRDNIVLGVSNMRRILSVLFCLGMASTSLLADTAAERLGESATILKEVLAAPDKGIPEDLLRKAHCVVVVPGVKQGAFIVGAKYGRGFLVCRTADGSWGAPGALRIEGGSVGFQIGGSETDVIMLVMDERSMKGILSSKFTLGGSADVAAGPVGRSSTAQTDATMNAKILSVLALAGSLRRRRPDGCEPAPGSRSEHRNVRHADPERRRRQHQPEAAGGCRRVAGRAREVPGRGQVRTRLRTGWSRTITSIRSGAPARTPRLRETPTCRRRRTVSHAAASRRHRSGTTLPPQDLRRSRTLARCG